MKSLFLAISVVLIAGTRATLEFQCWNLKSTDEIRQQYFTAVNKLREKLAKGNQDCNGAKCPKGKNMYRLNWDCLLENEAEKVVEKCEDKPTGPNGLGMVFRKVQIKTCNPKPLFKQTVEEWWNQALNVQPSSPVMSNDKAKDFATLAYGKATRIGCAQKNCNENLYIACMVYGKGPGANEAIYEQGEPCTAHTQCTTYEGSRCQMNTGLCLIGYPKNTTDEAPTAAPPTAPPTDSPPTAPPAPTNPQPQPTTAFPPDTTSSICPGNKAISNDVIRTAFWNGTNAKRSLVAKGMAKATHGTARPSCLMKKLRNYNCGLESTAYEIARRCFQQDNGGTTSLQNEHVIWNVNTAFSNAASQAVEAWYGEIMTGKLEQGEGQRNAYLSRNNIPHLARMLWETHTDIGCAIVKCTNFLKVVCQYTGQNQREQEMEGRQIYKLCPTCNRCPQKEACLNLNNGLCPV